MAATSQPLPSDAEAHSLLVALSTLGEHLGQALDYDAVLDAAAVVLLAEQDLTRRLAGYRRRLADRDDTARKRARSEEKRGQAKT